MLKWRIPVYVPMFFGLAAGCMAAEGPLAVHPDNPHYLMLRGKPVVLIGSGEHYGAVLNLDFDYYRYLDELKSHRLNHTRVFSGTYREVPSSFGITDNTLAPRPNRYLAPWARSESPGYFDGGNKFDLTRWDDQYFQRIRDFIAQAGRRDIVVEVSLFCPLYDEGLWRANPMNATNNINAVGQCPLDEVYTLKHPLLTEVQKAVVRKLAQELNPFDNFYFEICNEPWMGNVKTEWQHEMIATLVETERALPHRHLISLNTGSLRVTNPHPAVAIYNFHRPDMTEVVTRNYAINRVIGDNETGFRGRENLAYRTEAWDCILSGGGLFSGLDYSFTPSHPDGSLTDYKSPGGGNRQLRRELAVLKDFIHGFEFVRMSPHASIIRGSVPAGLAPAIVLAEPGEAYAVYLRQRTDADKFSVRWTGTITPPHVEGLTLHVLSNNGVRLWLNDKLVVDNARDHGRAEDMATSNETGRSLRLRLEVYNLTRDSVTRLSWSSEEVAKEVIPASALSTAEGAPGALTGEYFHDRKMTQPILSRNDSRLDFRWNRDASLPSKIPEKPFELRLELAAGDYRSVWLDPGTCILSGEEQFRHRGGERTIRVPAFSEDTALRITRIKGKSK